MRKTMSPEITSGSKFCEIKIEEIEPIIEKSGLKVRLPNAKPSPGSARARIQTAASCISTSETATKPTTNSGSNWAKMSNRSFQFIQSGLNDLFKLFKRMLGISYKLFDQQRNKEMVKPFNAFLKVLTVRMQLGMGQLELQKGFQRDLELIEIGIGHAKKDLNLISGVWKDLGKPAQRAVNKLGKTLESCDKKVNQLYKDLSHSSMVQKRSKVLWRRSSPQKNYLTRPATQRNLNKQLQSLKNVVAKINGKIELLENVVDKELLK